MATRNVTLTCAHCEALKCKHYYYAHLMLETKHEECFTMLLAPLTSDFTLPPASKYLCRLLQWFSGSFLLLNLFNNDSLYLVLWTTQMQLSHSHRLVTHSNFKCNKYEKNVVVNGINNSFSYEMLWISEQKFEWSLHKAMKLENHWCKKGFLRLLFAPLH